MSEDKKDTKVDVSSTTVEKGLDIAKEFVGKLVSPPVEELGLLIKDQISFWRFNNQVKILNKAKALCEKNQINVKAIPPKLLCPYLENASLEDDEELQNKWANLLVNMVDSRQNIENHVFPYILSQLSKDEFDVVEMALQEKERRVAELEEELQIFQSEKASIEAQLKEELAELKKKRDAAKPGGKWVMNKEAWKRGSEIRSVERKLSSLEYREASLRRRIDAPERIPEENLEEFEVANVIRLGLAKVHYVASAGTHSIDIPNRDEDSTFGSSVDFDIDIETESFTVLTELGELFVDACRDKRT